MLLVKGVDFDLQERMVSESRASGGMYKVNSMNSVPMVIVATKKRCWLSIITGMRLYCQFLNVH